MTTAASAADRGPRWRRDWTLVAIVFLFLLGLRLTVLRIYGAALPYSDQWDSEGWDLLRPYLLGQGVDWHMLFAPHNEHRIVFARLEALGLFALNDGQWDNLLGATANAFLVAALAALAVRALLRQPVRDRFAFAALLLVACCLPCGYENLLTGFQLQIYLLVALAVFGAWLVASRPAGAWLAAQCALVAGLSLFSVASGLLTPGAMLFGLLLRRWAARDAWRPYLAPMLVCVAATIAGFTLVVPVPGHAAMHAQGLAAWLDAVSLLGSWPLPGRWVCFALVWSPTVLATVFVLRRRNLHAIDVAAATLALWTAAQIASLAYGRARELAPIASRYTDVLVLTVLVNAWFCARLWRARPQLPRSRALAFCATAWLAVVPGAYALRGAIGAYAMHEFAASRTHQTRNVRRYVESGNIAGLREAEPWNVPYPDIVRLQRMLDDATLRSMLPADVRAPLSLGNFHGGFEQSRTVGADTRRSAPGPADPSAHLVRTAQRIDGLHSRMSYLKFPVTGRFGPLGLELRLLSSSGAQSRVSIAARGNEPAADVVMRVPGDEFALIVEPADPHTEFALGAPVEVGRLSRAVMWLLGSGPYILFASIAFATWTFRRVTLREIIATLRSGEDAAADPPAAPSR